MGTRARCWEGPGFRALYLPGITGVDAEGRLAEGAEEQAERLLANASAALAARGFSFAHVVRTWFYLARILEWYDAFNFDAQNIEAMNIVQTNTGFLGEGRMRLQYQLWPQYLATRLRLNGAVFDITRIAYTTELIQDPTNTQAEATGSTQVDFDAQRLGRAWPLGGWIRRAAPVEAHVRQL